MQLDLNAVKTILALAGKNQSPEQILNNITGKDRKLKSGDVINKKHKDMNAQEMVDSLDAVNPTWKDYLIDAGWNAGIEAGNAASDILSIRGSALARALMAASRTASAAQENQYGPDLLSNALQMAAAQQEFKNNMYGRMAKGVSNITAKTKALYDKEKSEDRSHKRYAVTGMSGEYARANATQDRLADERMKTQMKMGEN